MTTSTLTCFDILDGLTFSSTDWIQYGFNDLDELMTEDVINICFGILDDDGYEANQGRATDTDINTFHIDGNEFLWSVDESNDSILIEAV